MFLLLMLCVMITSYYFQKDNLTSPTSSSSVEETYEDFGEQIEVTSSKSSSASSNLNNS